MLSRGINYQVTHLVSTQKVHRLGGCCLVTSRRYYGRHKPLFLGVRMAKWLRPGLWEMLMLSRGIEPGQVLTSNKPTGEGWYCSYVPL